MKKIVISLKMLLLLTVLTGLVYPVSVTGLAQLFFARKANGSMIISEGLAVGSELIGQASDTSIYFSSRPSASSYDALPGGASNYALTNRLLTEQVSQRRKQFIESNRLDGNCSVPAEMLFASASGLDPHISPEAAFMQADRVANARNFNERQKQELLKCIADLTEPYQLLILGEKRINVLLLNLKTDQIK